MKRMLLSLMLLCAVMFIYGQTTYYWVGGSPGASNTNMNNGANWNTNIDGSGSTRPSSSGADDILVFDGTNLGGTTPVTGTVTVSANAGITCAQIKWVNNASIEMLRPSSGTTTMNIAGADGEDFIIEAGSSLSVVPTTSGSIRFAMNAANTGRVSGALSFITPQQCRIDNTTAGNPGSFIFTSGSSFTTEITSSSAAYAFGNSGQSSYGWVVFEAGSQLNYLGGYSPHGSGLLFSAIDMRPGSNWHQRGSNPISGGGNFFNRQSYGNIVVENNSELHAFGSIYYMENLTIETGSSFNTYSSGQTVVTGNIIANGNLLSPTDGSNKLVLAKEGAQTITGSGTIHVSEVSIADRTTLSLSLNIQVEDLTTVYGHLDFGQHQLTGTGRFYAAGAEPVKAGTGNLTAGSYFISGNSTFDVNDIGKSIAGTGIAPNAIIVALSGTADSIYISLPIIGTATGESLQATTSAATLINANTNGFDATTGAVVSTGESLYGDNINYIINGATTAPFGISTTAVGNSIQLGSVQLNAAVTSNIGLTIHDNLSLGAKLNLRPGDILHLATGATLSGSFSTTNYIATDFNSTTGDQAQIRMDGVTGTVAIPLGTMNYYLPVSLTTTGSNDIQASVFQGITTEGTLTGTAFSATELQTVVNAVWNITRTSGSGDVDVDLGWDAALEGATFITLPDTDIGLIQHNGSSWDTPVGTGNNLANSVSATVSNLGIFSAGAVPQVEPFVFNPLPEKVYGDAEFNGGATSLNNTEPIVYTSSNADVAIIVNGNIQITGAGTTDITASQATDGTYPAANVVQPLTVIKATLEIKADDQLKFEGLPNPTLTATYTGLVYSETPDVLLTPAVLSTTAETGSAPGTYPITVSGATSNNYTISFVNGTLTVQAKQNQVLSFPVLPNKVYGNDDFPANVSSNNATLPITYSSSNTSVATVDASGLIHITGAGSSTITAMQAGNDGYFAAAPIERILTVSKVVLTVTAADASKIEGTANPAFTLNYSGFVLGESAASLTTQPTVITTAGTQSTAGYYTLTPEGGVSQNYSFNYVPGRLTIQPATGTDQQQLIAFLNNNGNITVRVYSPEPTLGDILIFDMNGRPIARKNLFMPSGFIQTEVLTPALPTGTYVVIVKGDGVNLKKIIVAVK